MSRRAPPLSPPNIDKRDTGYATETRRYRLITPLFGGGVNPGEADPLTVIRGTTIRGHLRFWWRACRAGSFPSIEAMRQQEGEIWGSSEHPSPVSVAVSVDPGSRGDPEPAFRVAPDKKGRPRSSPSSRVPAYAAFPLQPDRTQQRQMGWQSQDVLFDVVFTLTIRYPQSLASEVEAALWAWETFGGIGARTRRGFGAVHRLDSGGEAMLLPANPQEAKAYLRGLLQRFVQSGEGNSEVPQLSPNMLLGFTTVRSSPLETWQHLIRRYRDFRQARHGSRYGLSQWPEANEIRRRLNLPPRLPEDMTEGDLVQKFPRAAFGLPIVFHLPHDRGTPDNITLTGASDPRTRLNYDRLASPLILRPLALPQGKGIGLAAILEAPRTPPQGLVLEGVPHGDKVISDLNQDEARRVPPLAGYVDVLQAFLSFLTEGG